MGYFNYAMLAKKGWRIVQSPHSFVARVLKAKYFPHSSFMKARMRNCVSYVLRSILEGKMVLEEGLRWRVENRELKSKMTIGFLFLTILKSFQKICSSNIHYRFLIQLIQRKKGGRRSFSKNFFFLDRDAILTILLVHSLLNNKLVWHFIASDHFTVCLVYHLAREKNWQVEGPEHGSLEDREQVVRHLGSENPSSGQDFSVENFPWLLEEDGKPTMTVDCSRWPVRSVWS